MIGVVADVLLGWHSLRKKDAGLPSWTRARVDDAAQAQVLPKQKQKVFSESQVRCVYLDG